jgi:omega-6 fatty acid desaturase (delta-12 desaturase)
MSPDPRSTLPASRTHPKAYELRALASPEAPRPSTPIGALFAVADYLLFFAGAAAAVVAPWWSVKLAGVIVAGVAVAMLFALAHDAAHGSLARSRLANRLLATLCFLPSWYPYTPWIRGHNHLHHGWTNVADCDYSWRPVSPAQYRAMPRWRRGVERLYRSWWALWLHSIVEIWWKHMVMPRDDDRRFLDARRLDADRLLVLVSVGALVAVCALAAPRWSTLAGGPPLSGTAIVAMVVLAPWWIFHVMFSVVTFLHHTHPRVPWFRTKRESTYFTGQVRATVHVTLPTWVELLLHNITVHSAHHVDPRVPFRHLPDAQRRLEDAFADDVIVERWSVASFLAVTRACKLYDYDRHEWRTFGMHVTSATTAPRRSGVIATMVAAVAATLLGAVSADAQPASRNVSRDLTTLGIAGRNATPNVPTLDARPLFEIGIGGALSPDIFHVTVDTSAN